MSKAKTYISEEFTQVDGRLFRPREPFTTEAPKAEGWSEVTPAEVAAQSGTRPLGSGDPSLESLDTSALKAMAADKGIDLRGVTAKKDIIAALHAAYEPKL